MKKLYIIFAILHLAFCIWLIISAFIWSETHESYEIISSSISSSGVIYFFYVTKSMYAAFILGVFSLGICKFPDSTGKSCFFILLTFVLNLWLYGKIIIRNDTNEISDPMMCTAKLEDLGRNGNYVRYTINGKSYCVRGCDDLNNCFDNSVIIIAYSKQKPGKYSPILYDPSLLQCLYCQNSVPYSKKQLESILNQETKMKSREYRYMFSSSCDSIDSLMSAFTIRRRLSGVSSQKDVCFFVSPYFNNMVWAAFSDEFETGDNVIVWYKSNDPYNFSIYKRNPTNEEFASCKNTSCLQQTGSNPDYSISEIDSIRCNYPIAKSDYTMSDMITNRSRSINDYLYLPVIRKLK